MPGHPAHRANSLAKQSMNSQCGHRFLNRREDG
jgi:hypothetical protein